MTTVRGTATRQRRTETAIDIGDCHETTGPGRALRLEERPAGLLADSLQLHSAVLESVGQAVVAVDLNRVIISWNRAAEEMFGWSAEEAIGQNSTELLVQGESARELTDSFEALARGQGWSGNYEIKRRDGTAAWVLATNRPVFDAEGQLVAVVGSSTDVTGQKAEDAARRQLSALVDSSADAIYGVTVHGHIMSWNHGAELLYGYAASEIIGQPVGLLAPDELRHEQSDLHGQRRPWVSRLGAGVSSMMLETTRKRKDDTLVDVLLTISRTNGEHGEVIGSSVIARDITESVKARRALEASSRRLAEAQRIAHLGSFEVNIAPTFEVIWSDEMYRIVGVEVGQPLDSRAFLARVHPDDRADFAETWSNATVRGRSFDISFRIVRPDDTVRSVRARVVTETDADGRVLKLSGTVADQTEWVEAEATRRAAESLFEIGFEQSAIGIVIADFGGIPLRINQAMRDLLGRTDAELLGRKWTDFSHPDDAPLAANVLERLKFGHSSYQDERRYIRPDGSVVWAAINVAIVRDNNVPQYVFAQLKDITERKVMETEMSHQALHDSLTGLPNRVLLTDRLLHGLAGSNRRDSRLGVIFLDLDQFKVVNDSMGHTSGDGLLSEAAKRIEQAIRPGDTVARFGGDEFVVVCDDIDAVVVERIAQRVLSAFITPWIIDGQELHVTASLGIAISNDDSTPESLLRDSDTAMYRAKELGRGRIEMFDETLSMKASRRLSLSSALHHALERNELSVHYQPIVDLATGEMVSVEALLRWNCRALGDITPAEFIPIAEDTGLIVPIGAWLLEGASRQLVEWQQLQHALGQNRPLSLAVNLSVRQMLAPDFADRIARVLASSGMKSSDLCLELTESVFMQDAEYFGRTLNELKALGVSVAIDDFGTGYSSLSYLRRFPVDAVKIAREFVDGLETEPNDTVLVQAIIAMARALGLAVTAEAVETAQQLACLTELGVPRAQGFFLAPPMPADEITLVIASSEVLIPALAADIGSLLMGS